jgi:acyl-CoA thioesterase
MAVAFLDTLPPALLSKLDAPRNAASVEWSVHFFGPFPHPLKDEEDVFVRAHTEVAGEGYAEEHDALFAKDGRLLARARQTIALL